MDTHLGKHYIGFMASNGIKDSKWILILSQSARVRDFKLNSQLDSFICFLMYRKKTLGLQVFLTNCLLSSLICTSNFFHLLHFYFSSDFSSASLVSSSFSPTPLSFWLLYHPLQWTALLYHWCLSGAYHLCIFMYCFPPRLFINTSGNHKITWSLFLALLFLNSTKYHKSQGNLPLPCFLRHATIFPDNLTKTSHRPKDTALNIQFLFVCLLHTISSCIDTVYTGSYFLHNCSCHSWKEEVIQHGFIFSRCCLFLFGDFVFPFLTWCHLQIPH